MSQQKPYLTVPEVAAFYDIPDWKIRRVVDSLDVDIPRAGNSCRLISRSLLGVLATELQRQGWLPTSEEAAVG